MTDEAQVREDLKNLLRFTEQLLATRDKVVFDISNYQIHLAEDDFRGEDGAALPGIEFGPGDDIWLSIARLRERAPPGTPPELRPWLRPDERPAPERQPVLRLEHVMEVTCEDASDLVEAGLADQERIAQLETRAGLPEYWAVPLRPSELPDVIDALDRYIAGPWAWWATEEAPRRQAIRLYEALYKAHAQISATGGEGGLELVVGIGLARWSRPPLLLNMPLIEQRAEFELNEADGRLTIAPRNVVPAPVMRPFVEMSIPGAAALQREMTARLDAIANDPDIMFGPFQPESFVPVLETCAARLDASGTVLAPDEDLGEPSDALRISRRFCVIVRTRRDDILRDDIRRLSEAILTGDAGLPVTASRFVTLPKDVPVVSVGPVVLPGRGIAGSQWETDESTALDERLARNRDWLFFPLPANEEQEEIARRLDQDDVHGVVVQGPPGTGKTHTIANIIGHSMAKGRRVLVSAHTAEALSAIRDKLPGALRDLAIAITHSDREGARQLEEAVSALANRVQAIDPAATKRRAEDLLRAIVRDDQRLAEIDAELRVVARANLTEMSWRGGKALPQAIAVWRAAQGDRHTWFPDRLDLIDTHEPRFSEAEMAEARNLRRQLGQDLRYRPDDIPGGATALPALGAVVTAHRALREAKARRHEGREDGLPRPDVAAMMPGELAHLLQWLRRLEAWRDGCGHHAWMHDAWQAFIEGRPMGRLVASALRPLLDEASRLAERHEALAPYALELLEIDDGDRLGEALARLARGEKPFGFFVGFGKSAMKQALDAARVAATPPRQAADWARLAELHVWRSEVPGFVARWNVLAGQHGLTRLPADSVMAGAAITGLGLVAGEMLALMAHAPGRIERLRVAFPYGLDIGEAVMQLKLSHAVAALRASSGDLSLGEAERRREDLRVAARKYGFSLGEALLQMAEGLGSPDAEDALVADRWREIQKEADRLATVRESLSRLHNIAEAVRQSGATSWAGRIAGEPAAADDDPCLPREWRDAWDWSRAGGFLARVANRENVRRLTTEQAELVKLRERRFLEVIEMMTLLGLHGRLTESVLAALRQFLSALAHMPKTAAAAAAVRQRRILRDSLRRCAQAVPCWIMPEWRVAEQLPPDLGSFDLVVIDEASQSNIMALPVVLRGKKLLIVGDDKQVTPSAVGVEDAAVSRLRITYLRGQPLADQMDPSTSLYELAGMMYPGRVVVLREHYRCVEPIIRFSSRFYGGHLMPMRLPRPSERIDPPLVDILVEDGLRRGDVNTAEAEVIIAEIRAVIADPHLNATGRRGIGVISLHADKQAKLIYDRLMREVGPEAMDAHRIMCGDASTFQGQERDIVFLSMVHDRNTVSRQSSRLYEQRYNVALSRARDRMVLVRSVIASDLKEGDIKLDVLRHFQNPSSGGRIAPGDDVLAGCQSEFERQVGKRLLHAGYRIRAQVPAGGYFIDFVVEGADDRRLAIELDGDSYHGPDRWTADLTRQKALERVGWTFWRCWASEWEADREAIFTDLVATLGRHGIAPIGAASPSGAGQVEFRRIGHRNPEVDTSGPGSTTPSPQPIGDAKQTENHSPSEPLLSEAPAGDPPARPGPLVAGSANRQVGVGDTVKVRFADGQARAFEVHIVADGSADGRQRIKAASPLAAAILGLLPEDEAEIVVDGKPRTVIVEAIQRAA